MYRDKYSHCIEAIHRRISTHLRQEPVVFFSAYDKDHEDLPVDNLDKTAIKGKALFIAEHDPFWGDGQSYQSQIVENPTWLDVAVLADEMIRTTNDYHHQCLEGIQKTKKQENGVRIYKFFMGS